MAACNQFVCRGVTGGFLGLYTTALCAVPIPSVRSLCGIGLVTAGAASGANWRGCGPAVAVTRGDSAGDVGVTLSSGVDELCL